MHHFLLLPAVAFAAYVLYEIAGCIYNVFFHPLRSYPGPKLWAASRIPISYWKIRHSLPFRYHELHEKYGDVVRVGPNFLSYKASKAWEEIYGFPKDGKPGNFQKDFRERPRANGMTNIITANDEDHRRFRRLQAHAFSDKALTSQEPLIQEYTQMFVDGLEKHSSASPDGTIDLGVWFNFATFDLIGDLAYGEPFGCLKTGAQDPWIALIFNMFKPSTIIGELAKYPILLPFLFLLPKYIRNAFQEHQELASMKVDRRLATKTERPDFTSYILKHQSTEKGMTTEEIKSNGAVLIVAGSETTAATLCGLTYFLLRNPIVLQNLTLEVRTMFQSRDELTLHNLARCKYMAACFEEAMRMFPPVTGTLPRTIPPGGAIILGKYVPGDTAVGVSNWSACYSPSNFFDPTNFHPERWLNADDVVELKANFPEMKLSDIEDFAGDDRKAKQSFSLGPRNCIGLNLAYAELRVLMGNVAWGFDLQPGEGSDSWMARCKMYSLWWKPPLNVKMKRVQS